MARLAPTLPTVTHGDWDSVIRFNRDTQKLFAKLTGSQIGAGAEPTFAGLTITGLTANRLVYADGNKELQSVSNLQSWITGTANEISVADDGDGSVTIGIIDPLIVAKGGTGAATFTDHGLLIGSGTSAFTVLAEASNGQLPIGSTGNDPVLATLTGTASQVTVTNGAGSITLSLPQDIATTSHPIFDYIILSTTQGVTGLTTTDHPTFDYVTLSTSQGITGLTTGDTPTFNNINLSISQGVTGLTVSDHPTFDYITLSTAQGITGLATSDHPTFDYLVLSTSQGVTGLTTADHPTFDYINLSTTQGVTGLATSDSPTFNNLTLVGTFNGHRVNPDGDNAYDLGESGRRWKDLYISGHITMSDTTWIGVSSVDPRLVFDATNHEIELDGLRTDEVSSAIRFKDPGGVSGGIDIVAPNDTRVRIYASDTTLATSPDGAAIQFFGIDRASYQGQAYIDSGAHDSAGIFLRTCGTSGTITERLRINATGDIGIGGVSSPAAQVHIDQSATDGAQPVLLLDQADISEEFVKFVGSAASGVLTQSIVAEGDVGTATRAGFVKVYVDDIGNQITDQAYFMPLFTLSA
jgi:hypothetical protein